MLDNEFQKINKNIQNLSHNRHHEWRDKHLSKFLKSDILKVLDNNTLINFLDTNASYMVFNITQAMSFRNFKFSIRYTKEILTVYIKHLSDLQQLEEHQYEFTDIQLKNKISFFESFNKIREAYINYCRVKKIKIDFFDIGNDSNLNEFIYEIHKQLKFIKEIEDNFMPSMLLWIDSVKNLRGKFSGHTSYEERMVSDYFISRNRFEKLYFYREELKQSPKNQTTMISYIDSIIDKWEKEYANRGKYLLKRIFPKLPKIVFNSSFIAFEFNTAPRKTYFNNLGIKYGTAIREITHHLHRYYIEKKNGREGNVVFGAFLRDYEYGRFKDFLDCSIDTSLILYPFKDWVNMIRDKANEMSIEMTGITIQMISEDSQDQ